MRIHNHYANEADACPMCRQAKERANAILFPATDQVMWMQTMNALLFLTLPLADRSLALAE